LKKKRNRKKSAFNVSWLKTNLVLSSSSDKALHADGILDRGNTRQLAWTENSLVKSILLVIPREILEYNSTSSST